MKYLIGATVKYRVDTIREVKELQEELSSNVGFSFVPKAIKAKGEIIDEYYLVTVKFAYNDEKTPDNADIDFYTSDIEGESDSADF